MQITAEAQPFPAPLVWPREVDLILSALEAGASAAGGERINNRRGRSRTTYRTQAWMHLFSDQPDSDPWLLYTRDVNSKSVGFIVNRPLPLGYGGTVELVGPRGVPIRAGCTIFRCRVATGDWYEGALTFNREQFNLLPR